LISLPSRVSIIDNQIFYLPQIKIVGVNILQLLDPFLIISGYQGTLSKEQFPGRCHFSTHPGLSFGEHADDPSSVTGSDSASM